jgi:predicted XRE-type DNA-binding protein
LDLGFRHEEAEHLWIRSDLMMRVQQEVASRRWTAHQAAKILRLSRARWNELRTGRIDLFTTDLLIDLLARLGLHVRIVLKGSRAA